MSGKRNRYRKDRAFVVTTLAAALVSLAISEPAQARRIVQNSVAKQFQIEAPADSTLGEKTLTGAAIPAPPQKIPCMFWVDRKPVAAMLCIHGFGLHKGTYDAFANEMAKRGIATYAIDCRGFGSWVQKGMDKVDFDLTMADIGLTLQEMRRMQPGLKIIVLGESMGGAIAMKTAEMYPDYVDGLISSVPAGDRYDKADSEIGVVKHILLHGWNSPIDVGPAVVGHATKKEDLRRAWLNDPLSRTKVHVSELIDFKKFMNNTFEVAPRIKETKVLFIQGCGDKLVRPAGTWKLFESLATPNREMVLSKSAEHLIFEDGQFSDKDLSFVTNWIAKNISPLSTGTAVAFRSGTGSGTTLGTDGSTGTTSGSSTAPGTTTAPGTATASGTGTTSGTGTIPGTGTQIAGLPPKTEQTAPPQAGMKTAITYWIELKRNGKVYRCNNKTSFQSGDAIRFHVMAEADGFAYVVLEQGSSGKSAVLFPSSETGKNNFLHHGIDYPLPYQDWLAFDAHPGLEKVRIMFSRQQISLENHLRQPIERRLIAYVSPDETGAKDLIGTRMQLSWDDPNPVIMPEEIQGSSSAGAPTKNSQVRLVFDHLDGPLAVDVALLHQ